MHDSDIKLIQLTVTQFAIAGVSVITSTSERTISIGASRQQITVVSIGRAFFNICQQKRDKTMIHFKVFSVMKRWRYKGELKTVQ